MIFAKLVGHLRKVGQALGSMLASPKAALFLGEPIFWMQGRRSRRNGFSLEGVRRVLILRLDEIGDVVMTTPLLRELRRNAPGAWITLVVKPATRNLVGRCPHVNEVLA